MDLSKFKGKKIIIVGDVGLDEYVEGTVKRISPEAPVPVVEVINEGLRLGLATNVAQNITSLGGICQLVSVIGNDNAGETLQGLLKENSVDSQYLVEDPSRPTTRKLRVMSGHHHVVRVDYEKKKYISQEIESKIITQVEKLLPNADGIILQDYAKGVLSKGLIQKIIAMAKTNKVRVVVDPYKTTPIEYYKGCDLMTPNSDEAIVLSGLEIDDLREASENFKEVGHAIMSHLGCQQMVVTRGNKGMCLYENGKIQQIPTKAKDVFDVTGAGDTVVAALTLAWCSGYSLEDSCHISNHAAGVVVGKIGCVPCTLEELKKTF